jgi:hypothetical protein
VLQKGDLAENGPRGQGRQNHLRPFGFENFHPSLDQDDQRGIEIPLANDPFPSPAGQDVVFQFGQIFYLGIRKNHEKNEFFH